MKTSTWKRMRRATLVALASMLLAAPAAQARPDEGGGAGTPKQRSAGSASNDGFSWGAAGVGAGAAAGVLVIAGGAGLVVRKRYLPAHS
jgi:hypothetical protein